MKWFFGLLLAFSSIVAIANDIVVDKKGVPHGTGYVKSLTQGAPKFYFNPEPTPLPDEYDSRKLGFIGPVKDQGSCGSCWAFGETEVFEDSLTKAGKPAMTLAPQQMVSCDRQAAGCGGGNMDDAQYLVDVGLALEKDYPYRAATTRCKRPLPKIAAKAATWAYVGAPGRAPTVVEIKQAVLAYGEGFTTVEAGGPDWSGQEVMTHCRNSGSNHIVTIVGWTKANQWIMRNSWGVDWGNGGYALMPFGCDNIAGDPDSFAYIIP